MFVFLAPEFVRDKSLTPRCSRQVWIVQRASGQANDVLDSILCCDQVETHECRRCRVEYTALSLSCHGQHWNVSVGCNSSAPLSRYAFVNASQDHALLAVLEPFQEFSLDGVILRGISCSATARLGQACCGLSPQSYHIDHPHIHDALRLHDSFPGDNTMPCLRWQYISAMPFTFHSGEWFPMLS